MDENELAAIGKKLEANGYLTYYEFEYYTQGLFNMEMKRFAEQNGLLVFDGISVFPENKYPFFTDQIHLNQKGTPIFADALYAFMLKNDIAAGGKDIQ